MTAVHQVLLAGITPSYQIPYSLRFRWNNTAYLTRTGGASPTNDKIFTWSGWVKLGLSVTNNADYGVLFSGYTASSDAGFAKLSVNNSISGVPSLVLSGWATNWRITSAAFRDPSAWYHIVAAIDTTQATAGDRIKLYVNGTQITSFGTSNNPALNATMGLNNASTTQRIGLDAPAASSYRFDGHMAEVNFVDGQALTPSSFGQTDSATGVWVPKRYAGTYGANGFYLKFNDATSTSTISQDNSGNGNNFTSTGISVTAGGTFDRSTDTPTLNYPVISAINSQAVVSVTEAGTASTYAGVANTGTCLVSVPFPTTGKWYYEHTCVATGASDYWAGVMINKSIAGNGGNVIAVGTTTNGEYSYRFNGNKMIAGVASAYGATYTGGDIIGVAFDATNLTIEFFKNGVSQGQLTGMPSGEYIAFTQQYNGGSTRINFGQRPFSYTVPTNFKALNTANLLVPSIKKGSLYMDAVLYTGNGTSQSVTGYGFQPDLVWIKGRNYVSNHRLSDAVRGVNNSLIGNSTAAQDTSSTNYVTAFNANGFSVSSGAGDVNQNTQTYVAWAWKESVTPGFDIMTYTGNGVSGRTVSHSLGVTPAMIVVKNRSTAGAFWSVAHKSLTLGYNLLLNDTGAQFLPGNAAYGGISTFSSSTFTVVTGLTDQSNVNTNGDNYVAYLWSEIEGFSKFGSYTGNASTDGPFVWCGLRPKFVLIKNASAATNWEIMDSSRDVANPALTELYPNSSSAENASISDEIDFLANGFKIRSTNSIHNASGNTFVFAAFAENPFKHARAR